MRLRHPLPRHPICGVLRALAARRAEYRASDLPGVEAKWKARWLQRVRERGHAERYAVAEGAEKKYILSQFPYPSGRVHMGHVRVYCITDALSRYQRCRGRRVLHPMGWDAFGLPAENAAIERGVAPGEWTRSNIVQMREQLDTLSFNFDWDREVVTCEPDYYRWTQWLFLRLFKAGLAYQKRGTVNWDPVDATVLANEQVDAAGRSWRSGAVVEKRDLKQWYLAITKYSDRLLAGLRGLDWPSAVKDMQRHWIAKESRFHTDLQVLFPADLPSASAPASASVRVVLDRVEDLCWADALRLPEAHPLARVAAGCGGLHAANPATGLPLSLLFQGDGAASEDAEVVRGAVRRRTGAAGLAAIEGREMVSEYRLRDWLISRQRYWGTPIPIVHCAACGAVPVPEDELPVVLPENVPLTGKGGAPLAALDAWASTACPSCGGAGRRETDTMDTFMDSAWYYVRYCDPKNGAEIAGRSAVERWLPVDVCVGGIEHAIMHLLYARFLCHFLMDQWGLRALAEPFAALITQGMVEGVTYRCPESGRYLRPDEVDVCGGGGVPRVRATGAAAVAGWEKMSKSKHNGVDPVGLVETFGADTVRLCVLFKAPPELSLQWSTRDIAGPQRWLVRLLNMAKEVAAMAPRGDGGSCRELDAIGDRVLAKMERAYDPAHHSLNLAVAHLMAFTNDIRRLMGSASDDALRVALLRVAVMLHPMAPHTSAEMRELLGQPDDLPLAWPKHAQPRHSSPIEN